MNTKLCLGNLKKRDHLKKMGGKAKNRDRSFGIVSRSWTGQPRNRGSISESLEIFLHSPKCPNSLWGPPSPLFNGYQGRFPQG